jgi:inner membrane protein
MDSLTHLLVGHAMGAAAAAVGQPYGAAAYWAVLIGNSIPDIDVPISLILRRDIKLHRTVTHTLPGVMVLSFLTAAAITRVMPGTPLGPVFLWALLGSLVHMGMDCLNVFGARALWPLSGRTLELGVLHILDPFLLLLLGVASLAVALHKAPQGVLALSFLAIWPYVGYRIATARRLYWSLRARGSRRVRIIPWYNSWRYVFETAQAVEFGLWTRQGPRTMKRYPKQESPLIRATLTNPKVAAFLRAAEYPYALVEEDEHGPAVVWGDALRQMRADFRPLKVRVDA